ncbi:MAG: DNA polymerase III subunit beta [Patescibacteria group bacterium]
MAIQLLCALEKFKKAISNIERVVSKQNTLPILNNVLIRVKKGALFFLATNLEIGEVIRIGARVEKEGEIAIPAKILANFINNLPKNSENLEISIDNQNLKINNVNTKTIIRGLNGTDFPLIPERSSEMIISFNSGDLRDIINRLMTSVSLGDVRPELGGINLIMNPEEIYFASTDSFRLSEARLNLEGKIKQPEIYQALIQKKNDLIVPAGTFLEVSRIIQNNEDEEIGMAIEDGQIFFEMSGIRLVSRVINGRYPEYKHIMPKEYQIRAVANKDELANMIRIASIFGKNKATEISLKINIKNQTLVIQGRSSEIGENSSRVGADIVGGDLEIVLNARYLIDGLSNITTKQVAVLFNSDTSPIALKEIDEKSGEVLESYVYIVMPIKNS